MDRSSRREESFSPVRMALLGGFDLRIADEQVDIPPGSARLLGFVALTCQGAVSRALVAGSLWPEAPDRCAYANLRSALSRLNGVGREALDVSTTEVRLAREVSVDFHHAQSLAHFVLGPDMSPEDPEVGMETIHALSTDLLPGWYEDWALLQAESWLQLRTHALEKLAEGFTSAGRFAEAVAAAHAAVCANPLRESCQALLIRAHLAEGNPSEALSVFERYEEHLRAEMGLQPTPRLNELVSGLPRSP